MVGGSDRLTKAMSSRLSWRAGLRRWRRWIIALLILIVVRALLPLVLRSVIASQASKAVHARVQVGDVDLALYKLGIALNDVAVYAASPAATAGGASGDPPPAATPPAATPPAATPPAATPPAATPPAATPPTTLPTAAPAATTPPPTAEGHASEGAPSEQPLIAWKRLAVSVRWLPLFKKAIILRDIELDSPRIALERLADGKLNLMALVPASAAEPSPTPAATPAETAPAGSGWGIGLDHLIVRDGAVRFHDLKVENVEPIELNIPTIAVTAVYLIPGQYGEPSKASITVDVDKGSLQVEATLTQRSATENQLEAYLKARNLPVRRARLYIPKVGWSALQGGLDADITYNFDTGTQNAVRGSATVNDFAVRVADLDEPALAWKTLTVKIDPVDLREQRAVVSSVDLNGATLLVRASGGVLLPFLAAVSADQSSAPPPQNPAAPAAPPAAASAAAPPAKPAPPWRWSVSSLHIGDTRVRMVGTPVPFEVGVGLDLTDLADHADQPAHIALALTAGQGRVNVEGGVRVAPPGFGGTLKIADLSVPELGIASALPKDLLQAARLGSDLTVEAGLAATKEGSALAASDVRVKGTLSLADVRLTPPSPPGLSVGVRAIDLAFDELQVPAVLPGASDVPAAGDGSAALAAGDVHARGKLSLTDVNVAAAGPEGYTLGLHTLDLGITDLLARGAVPVRRENQAAAPSSGDVQVAGRLVLADLRAARLDTTLGVGAVDLALDELQVPGVLSTAAGVPAAGSGSSALLPGDVHARAKLSVADVKVAAAGQQGYTLGLHTLDLGIADLLAHGAVPIHHENPPAVPPSGDVQVAGQLALADFRVAGADAKTFSAGLRAFELPFKEIALPGVLSHGAAAEAMKPMHVALGDVRLTAPNVRITRTADGLALPNFSGAQTPGKAAPPPAPARAAPASASPTPPRVDVAVDSFRLTDGNVAAVDRSVKPFYEGGLSALNLDVTKLRWPDLAIGNLRFTATGAEKGKIDVYGAIATNDRWVQVYVDKLALVPLNPYATAFSAYSIGTGKASVVSKVSSASGNYYADNYLTLHNLDVRGGTGESLFQENFGISLPMALALMRDTQGNIGLDIPVTVDQEGTKIGIATVIRSALQRAILGALTSPLKMVGAAFGGGGKIEAVAPPTISFLTGRADFADEGAEQVGRVAALLASRPGIGVTLYTTVTPADVRWLGEQALREEWAGQGLFAKLKDLPDRGARNRVEKALEARAHDEEGKLDPEDAKMLDHWLDERPPIPAERLKALADARLARVEEALRSQHGIEPNRIARGEPPAGAPPSETPAVRVELGPAGAPAAS
jgi:uncharacterized protein involved in outer membrane biogenesis